MWNVNVKAGDSRDFLGQKRFFPFSPENVLIGQYTTLGIISRWLLQLNLHSMVLLTRECSFRSVKSSLTLYQDHFWNESHMYDINWLNASLSPQVRIRTGTRATCTTKRFLKKENCQPLDT